MEDQEVVRLYGPWHQRTPAHALELLRDYPGRWWVAGGFAIEAFTGYRRPHADLDVGIPREDAPLLAEHLRGRLDVWAADHGSLRPLTQPAEPVAPTCSNLWLRASGAQRWEYDVLLTGLTAGTWTYEHDAAITLPVEHLLCTRAGVAYLLPQVQLLHKAAATRPKDDEDFDACLPLLDRAERQWLRAALDTAHRGHPWRARLT